MRIISKNHDYYDGVMAYGADPSIVFERKPITHYNLKEFDPDLEAYLLPLFKLLTGTRRLIEPFAVIFCGKIYLGIKMAIEKECKCEWHCTCNWYGDKYITVYCYDIEGAIKVLEGEDIDADHELSRRAMINGRFLDISPTKRAEIFFENTGSDKFTNLMINKKCPILLAENAWDCRAKLKGEENCELKSVKFFKVFDPYTTYQNLSMFIGGVLTKEVNPTVDISDADMVIKKGFDKWSFRKMKGD